MRFKRSGAKLPAKKQTGTKQRGRQLHGATVNVSKKGVRDTFLVPGIGIACIEVHSALPKNDLLGRD
jgi:hypothetical protein